MKKLLFLLTLLSLLFSCNKSDNYERNLTKMESIIRAQLENKDDAKINHLKAVKYDTISSKERTTPQEVYLGTFYLDVDVDNINITDTLHAIFDKNIEFSHIK